LFVFDARLNFACSQVISADEARHAQLGWSFVRWYLAGAGSAGAKVVGDLFAKHNQQGRSSTVKLVRD
jgi:hypothetical protein